MALKKCLLVTEDPDDHQAFTDATRENVRNAVVLVILDSEKALHLLLEKSLIPDAVFIDLFMNDIKINTFLTTFRADPVLRKTPIIIYGDEEQFVNIHDSRDLIFFKKDYEYKELKSLLSSLFEK